MDGAIRPIEIAEQAAVPCRAIKLGRRGRAAELNPAYFLDGVTYCEAMEREVSTPSLFDLEELEAEAA